MAIPYVDVHTETINIKKAELSNHIHSLHTITFHFQILTVYTVFQMGITQRESRNFPELPRAMTSLRCWTTSLRLCFSRRPRDEVFTFIHLAGGGVVNDLGKSNLNTALLNGSTDMSDANGSGQATGHVTTWAQNPIFKTKPLIFMPKCCWILRSGLVRRCWLIARQITVYFNALVWIGYGFYSNG